MTSKDFGFLAIEIYFPRYFIAQTDLEEADKCPGKYTKGLGQISLGVCSVQEDINSLCLTVLSRLVARTGLDLKNVGFLEVGTETLVDKSKSTKSVLMQLFEGCGNTDVQGVDVKNACFGGTAALFHALDWLESSAWDGRLAIVIAADIAVYGTQAARPTGGAGAAALLLGPNAPLVVDPGLRHHHICHTYDFYKPDLGSEYPVVDGQFSLRCYRNALTECYHGYKTKALTRGISVTTLSADTATTNSRVDYFCFHSPYTKLVRKGFGWLVSLDFMGHLADASISPTDPDAIEKLTSAGKLPAELVPLFAALLKKLDNVSEREADSILTEITTDLFASKVEPGLVFARHVGNMYTASLYSCLASLLLNLSEEKLRGRRILLYSYGSGSAAAIFSVTIHPSRCLSQFIGSTKHNRVTTTATTNALLHRLFEQRTRLTMQQFEELLEERKKHHNTADFRPVHRPNGLFPGTYYLESVDNQYRRYYKQTPE